MYRKASPAVRRQVLVPNQRRQSRVVLGAVAEMTEGVDVTRRALMVHVFHLDVPFVG